MTIKKMVSIAVCFSLLLSYSAGAINQNPETDNDSGSITMNDILTPEKKTIYISDETLFYPGNNIVPNSGQYPISTRVRVVQSSSNGLIEEDSAIGTYASIGGIALSFVKFTGSIVVSTIFSVVGLVASPNTYCQAKTFTSYVQYQKQGEAKWADDSAYSAWVLSGKRDYYKHILGGTRNSNGQWTTKSYDYLDSPAHTDIGLYYNNSDSWFKDQANQRIQNGLMLFDLPW